MFNFWTFFSTQSESFTILGNDHIIIDTMNTFLEVYNLSLNKLDKVRNSLQKFYLSHFV